MVYNLLVHIINNYIHIYGADPLAPSQPKMYTNVENEVAPEWDPSFYPTAHEDDSKYPPISTDTAPLFIVPKIKNPITWPYLRNLEQVNEPTVIEIIVKFTTKESLNDFLTVNDSHPDLEEFYKEVFTDYIDPEADFITYRFQQIESTEY